MASKISEKKKKKSVPPPVPGMSAGATQSDGDVIQIKKYGNRRLYSSSETRFVTIEELADLVRKGRKVKVSDAETGEDITSEILTQILLEGGRAQHFPVELLEQMIRVNERALQTFWNGYIEQSMKVLENFRENWQENLQENWQSLRHANFFMQWLGGDPAQSKDKAKESVSRGDNRSTEK